MKIVRNSHDDFEMMSNDLNRFRLVQYSNRRKKERKKRFERAREHI